MISLTSIIWWNAYSEGTLSHVMCTLRSPHCEEVQASHVKRKQCFQSPVIRSSTFRCQICEWRSHLGYSSSSRCHWKNSPDILPQWGCPSPPAIYATPAEATDIMEERWAFCPLFPVGILDSQIEELLLYSTNLEIVCQEGINNLEYMLYSLPPPSSLY